MVLQETFHELNIFFSQKISESDRKQKFFFGNIAFLRKISLKTPMMYYQTRKFKLGYKNKANF